MTPDESLRAVKSAIDRSINCISSVFLSLLHTTRKFSEDSGSTWTIILACRSGDDRNPLALLCKL